MSLLRSNGSRYSQAGGWTSGEVAKGAQGRVGKQLLKSKGPSRQTGIVTAKKKLNLLFLRVRRREMKAQMKMMICGENQCVTR